MNKTILIAALLLTSSLAFIAPVASAAYRDTCEITDTSDTMCGVDFATNRRCIWNPIPDFSGEPGDERQRLC